MARYAGKVIAFEANPAVAHLRAASRRATSRWFNAALSSRAGRTTLTVPLKRQGPRGPPSWPALRDSNSRRESHHD